MFGIFYPEDINNILQIDMMIRNKHERERKKQKAEERRLLMRRRMANKR